MIIDMHYHLDERIENVDRIINQMEYHKIDKTVLIPSPVDPFKLNKITDLISDLGRNALLGYWHFVGMLLYNSTRLIKGKFFLIHKAYNIYEMPDNNSVEKVIKAYHDKFYGWIFINPACGDPIIEIAKRMQCKGWIGVKSHPFFHDYPIRILDEVGAYCDENNLPLLIHLGGNKDNGDFRFLPERHPNLKIIFAHAGIPYYNELWNYIKGKDNLFVDLSSPYLNYPLRLKAIKALGYEKCMYGTDGPYGYPDIEGFYDRGAIIKEILNLPITDKEKERILGENFTCILPKSLLKNI